jgi:hypothetical protein
VKSLSKGQNTLNERKHSKRCRGNFISVTTVPSLTKGTRVSP